MVRAHSLISLSLFWFLVQFLSCWALFVSSLSFNSNYSLLLFVFFNKYLYNGTSGRSSLSSSPGSFSGASFSAAFFDHFPFLFFDFLDGGWTSFSDLSFSYDLSLSFLWDFLCGLLANLSFWCPPCLCSLIPDKALCTTLKDSAHLSATACIPPTLLITLSPNSNNYHHVVVINVLNSFINLLFRSFSAACEFVFVVLLSLFQLCS